MAGAGLRVEAQHQAARRLVEWTQSLRLGDPEWAWEDQPPGSLMLGFDPQTGPGHEPDYFAPEALA